MSLLFDFYLLFIYLFIYLFVCLSHLSHTRTQDFKNLKTREAVTDKFKEFLQGKDSIRDMFLCRLNDLRDTLSSSPFFASHEVRDAVEGDFFLRYTDRDRECV